ncbi:MAG: hypothetical protein FJ386_13605 [Verrucomicrobia bacterium]|nr:hypothetical protein [Verrucomicrobiota bacterium]
MNDLLLKLLGARVEAAGDIAGVKLTFHGGAGVGWVVFLALALGALTWWTYRNSPVALSASRRFALTALRMAFLASVILLLLRPVLAFTVEGSIRRACLVLVDASSSMQIKDPRVAPDDVKRAAIAKGGLDAHKGLAPSLPPGRNAEYDQLSRLDVVRGALKNERLDLLPRLDLEFEIVPFSFGQRVNALPRSKTEVTNTPAGEAKQARRKAGIREFEWVDRLAATSPTTPLGDALTEVVKAKRGQPLAGVVLITDGANNTGTSPREAAALARQEGAPLYIWGVGITSPRDIIVANLFAPEVSFVKDEVLVNVRVRSQGLNGEKARIVLKLGDTKVDEKEITFGPDGEQVVPMQFTPQDQGDFEMTASITPRDDETVKDNNARAQHLRVIDTKIKVLLVEQSPRWEFRYLHAMLTRDRRIESKTVLFEGDPSITRGDHVSFLERFPATKEELYTFDLVVFGDVDPRTLTPEQMRNLNEYVSKFGGAFLMVAGKRFSPGAYRRTPIEQLLPVEFDAAPAESVSAGETIAEKPIRLALTTAGRTSTMLRLADKEDESAAFWKELPPIYWAARVARAKPGAEVLLVDPDPLKASRFGPMPVVALQQYGLGQAMFVGTDNTWRWRKNVGDAHYTAFWSQIAQRLALPHLIGGSRKTQLTTDRQNFVTGDRVNLFARLYRAGFEPVTDPAVRGLFSLRAGDTGAPTEVSLRPVPEQQGVYRGEFVAPAPGNYRFWTDLDPDTRLDFNVTAPQFELGETAMSETLLREMAALSGGAFFREEDLHKLPDAIKAGTDRVRSPLEVELWASPLYFLLMLLLITVEWVLRKLSHLK